MAPKKTASTTTRAPMNTLRLWDVSRSISFMDLCTYSAGFSRQVSTPVVFVTALRGPGLPSVEAYIRGGGCQIGGRNLPRCPEASRNRVPVPSPSNSLCRSGSENRNDAVHYLGELGRDYGADAVQHNCVVSGEYAIGPDDTSPLTGPATLRLPLVAASPS